MTPKRKEIINQKITDKIINSTNNAHTQVDTNSKIDFGIGGNDRIKVDVNVDVKEDTPISFPKITINPTNVRVSKISITPTKIPEGKLRRPRGSKNDPNAKVETKNGALIQPIKIDKGKDSNITIK